VSQLGPFQTKITNVVKSMPRVNLCFF